MGKRKLQEGVFARLGKGNLLHKRGHKMQNRILLNLEDRGIPKDSIKFEMEGTDIKVSIDPSKVPEDVVKTIEEDLQDFEDGILFSPNEQEMEFMREISNSLEGE